MKLVAQKTTVAKPGEVEQKWFVVDATDKIVGRLASEIAVILMGVWMGHYRGGFAWSSEPDIQFNWHPMLMLLGLVYLYGNGNGNVSSFTRFS